MAIVLLTIPAAASDSGPVTEDNWLSHPETQTVRKIYRSVEDAIASGKIRMQQRAFEYCEPYADVLRVINSGRNGVVRKYYLEGGSDDSAMRVSHYYDGQGTLRFVFARGGAVNGTIVEYRIYLDSLGDRFWSDYRLVDGPGYTFPETVPEEELVRDPKTAFAAENICPET